jgi:predicted DNA-binding protein (MmcQ/YjbR family)
MITTESFRILASSFPGVEELPHFEKTSFRINKKIFATLNEKESRGTVMLSENDQYIFCLNDRNVVYPVPNKWGLQGWTNIELTKINKRLLTQILKAAYNHLVKSNS